MKVLAAFVLLGVLALGACSAEPVRARMPGDRAPPPPGLSAPGGR